MATLYLKLHKLYTFCKSILTQLCLHNFVLCFYTIIYPLKRDVKYVQRFDIDFNFVKNIMQVIAFLQISENV